MKNFLILVCVGLALTGCGGGGGGSVVPSPFAGTFSGTFTTSSGQNGTANMTVSSSGNMVGTIHNNTVSADGTVSGHIDNAGNASGSYRYSPDPAVSFTGVMNLSGTTLSGALSGGGGSSNFTLTKM